MISHHDIPVGTCESNHHEQGTSLNRAWLVREVAWFHKDVKTTPRGLETEQSFAARTLPFEYSVK